MKICFVIRSLPPYVTGGAQTAVDAVARELVKCGHRITVLTKKYRRDRRDISREYEVKYMFSLPKDMLAEGSLYASLFSEFLYNRYDVVMAINMYPTGYCCAKLRRLFDLPLVMRPIGIDVQVDKTIDYGLRLDPRVDRKVRYALSNCDSIIVTSRSMKDEVVAAGALSHAVSVVPNGVDLREFEEAKPCELERPYLLTVARLEKKKGIDILLRAYERVAERVDDLNLVIAGDGPERESLERLVGRLGLARSVKFLGTVTGAEKVALYKGCAFFVCPSRWEPFGITNLEAMAAGKTVVATRVGGIPEIVQDGFNGLLFDRGDPENLAARLLELIESNARRKELERNARKFILAYNWRAVAQRYLGVLQKIARYG